MFSPDGHWVAYDSNESGKDEIYAVAFPNATARFQISTAGGQNVQWRADGKELYYTDADNKIMARSGNGSGVWEFTTVVSGSTHWNPSTYPCDPQTWSANAWHPVQLITHTDGAGNAFYDSVILEGRRLI